MIRNFFKLSFNEDFSSYGTEEVEMEEKKFKKSFFSSPLKKRIFTKEDGRIYFFENKEDLDVFTKDNSRYVLVIDDDGTFEKKTGFKKLFPTFFGEKVFFGRTAKEMNKNRKLYNLEAL